MTTSADGQADAAAIDQGQKAINDLVAQLGELKQRFENEPAPQGGGPKSVALSKADMDRLGVLCEALKKAKLPPAQQTLCLTRADLELIFLAIGSALVVSGGGRVGPGSTPILPK